MNRSALVRRVGSCTRWLSGNPPSSTRIPLKVLHDQVKEQQKLKKGEICDKISIYVRAGAGGQGYPRLNGIGGDGGSVWIEALPAYQTLNHLHQHYNRRFVGEEGENSGHALLRGSRGEDEVVEVPAGTIATDVVTNRVICDVDQLNSRYLLQRGVRGGCLSNNYIGRRAPERWVRLVLKSIADVGLVGYPNAGKSSLLSLISNANPIVGSYPFTTLKPTVGYMETTDRTKCVGVADIPGLIEGAADNHGLGHIFLQHIERTSALLFVIDITGFQLNRDSPERTAFETFGYLCRELELYMGGLTKRPIVIATNKMDLEGADKEFERFKEQYKSMLSHLVHIHSIIPISCYTGQGLLQLQNILFELKYGPESENEYLYRETDDSISDDRN